MNISVMRSDRRKNPERVAYEFLTFEECKNLGSESHCHILDNNGKIAQVKITSVKTWKTRPNELLIGWKFGLYEYGKFLACFNMGKCNNGFFVRIVPNEIEQMAREKIQEEYDNAGVELIASGYEWICPKCETLNHEIETSSTVECDECHDIFEVRDVHHANG